MRGRDKTEVCKDHLPRYYDKASSSSSAHSSVAKKKGKTSVSMWKKVFMIKPKEANETDEGERFTFRYGFPT